LDPADSCKVEGIEKQEIANGRGMLQKQALIRHQRKKIELELRMRARSSWIHSTDT
jgi:hypothetical protein